MTITLIRNWRFPSSAERVPWSTIYTRARALLGADSALELPDQRIEDAVAAAANALGEYGFRHEEWYADLTEWPEDGIELPWAPTGIVRCSWAQNLDNLDGWGQTIDSSLYHVNGTSWRYLGDECTWPTGTVRWSLEVTGRIAGPDDEPDYCTVPLSLLWPLVELEVSAILELLEGRSSSWKVLRELVPMRMDLARRLRFPQRPPTLTAGPGASACGWVIFQSAADDSYTLGDLP